MNTVPTFTATIYVGFRERYTGTIRGIGLAEDFLRYLANQGGLCVTITPTRYIYKDGDEPGCAVGLINYPRFPEEPSVLRGKALSIAEKLMNIYKQLKVSVVFPDETVMIENEDQ